MAKIYRLDFFFQIAYLVLTLSMIATHSTYMLSGSSAHLLASILSKIATHSTPMLS